MKDYSEKFKEPQSYITYIDIDQKKQLIYITFSNGEIFNYPLTKENISKFYKRLAEQYILAGENCKKVVNNKITPIFTILAILTAIISIILLNGIIPEINISVETISPFLLGAIGLDGIVIGFNEAFIKKNDRQKITIASNLLKSNTTLKECIEKEENILNGLDKDAIAKIKTETQSLVKYDLEPYQYTVNWIDKLDLSTLEQIQRRLKIYQGLQKSVELSKGEHVKTRKRTLEEK